jgi:hypothetical protein
MEPIVLALKRRYWGLRAALDKPIRFYKLVTDSELSLPYFPEVPRKSRLRTLLDFLWWLARHRETSVFYYVRGLDRKEASAARAISWREFVRRRDGLNSRPSGLYQFYDGKHNYLCLTRDKFLFGQYIRSLGFSTPRTLGILSSDRLIWADGRGSEPLQTALASLEGVECFCKPLDGIIGRDVFPLSVKRHGFVIGGKVLSNTEVAAKIGRQRYLLQEKITQHPRLAELYPHAVNTLRVVTVAVGDNIEVLTVALRMGANGIRTDNWATGGIILRVDVERECGTGYGFFKPGRGLRVTTHPNTGVKLDGFTIPFIKEAVAVAKSCHHYFYGLHSIGWDIAITADGPSIIEGNDDWDGAIPMTLDPDFQRKFYASHRTKALPPQLVEGLKPKIA